MNRKIASLAAGVTLGLSALSANASHIPGLTLFEGQTFTFTPDAAWGVPGTVTSFTADSIDFSYRADVDQTNTSPTTADFTETGVAFFSTFQLPLGNPLDAGMTGLNNGYRMYLVFTGTGEVEAGGGGAINGTFSTFNLTIYIDPLSNSATVPATVGAPNQTTSVSNTGDDIAILSGTLNVGGFHVFDRLANGDFDVLFNVTTYNAAVWGGAAFAGDLNGDGDFLDDGESVTDGDINGVNTSLQGFGASPFDTVTDLLITGSGNLALRTVPVPGVLGLMGAGLLGLGLANRRRK